MRARVMCGGAGIGGARLWRSGCSAPPPARPCAVATATTAARQPRGCTTSEARGLLADGLRAVKLERGELAALPGNDPRKVAIAQAIRRQTTVSNGWLAERLAMRSAANVSQILRRPRCRSALSRYVA